MNFPQYKVTVLNPKAISKESLDNIDIAFYSRNTIKYDLSVLLSLRKVNGQCRFVFLDTELNQNRFLLNSALLLKKIEYHTLKLHFKKIERYYIPIVLGENMNWSISLNYMSENNISLNSYFNGSINVIEISSLLREIISYKSISPKSCKVKELAEDYSVDFEIIEESVLSKVIFYLKYNPVTSFMLLVKNQIIHYKSSPKFTLNRGPVQFTGFYKLVISE